jgi:hypothetical protein
MYSRSSFVRTTLLNSDSLRPPRSYMSLVETILIIRSGGFGTGGAVSAGGEMTGVTGILERSRRAVQYASSWTLSEIVENIPNKTCARLLGAALSGVIPLAEPLVCPQPITPDCRATLELHQSPAHPPFNTRQADEPYSRSADGSVENHNDNVPAEGLEWALLLPVTSRGASSPKAFWERVEESFEKLLDSIDAAHRENTAVYLAFDHNDPELDTPEALERLQVLHHTTRARPVLGTSPQGADTVQLLTVNVQRLIER